LGYGELVGDQTLHVRADLQVQLIDPSQHRVIGKPVHRVDIPSKLTGGGAFVHDLRLPHMLHGRVVLPPSYGARLRHLDSSAVKRAPGVVKVVQDGAFLGVIAEQEHQAVLAMTALQAAAEWDEEPSLPDPQKLSQTLAGLPAQTINVRDDQIVVPASAIVIEASYSRPYQMHAAIGPSCAVALLDDGALTVWTHSQGVYPLRGALAELTGLNK
jgi:nicotinate dehydrogenase subunit B